MNVVTVARTKAALEAQAKALMAELNVEVRPVACDLSSSEGTQTIIDAVSDLEIGVLVPCAALESRGYFVDASLAHHQALIQMDVIGPMALAHHFGAKMAKQGRGAILFVSSLKIGFTFGLASVAWFAFEKPILRLKDRFVLRAHPRGAVSG